MVAIVGTPLGSIITKSRFCIFEDRAFVGGKLNVGAPALKRLTVLRHTSCRRGVWDSQLGRRRGGGCCTRTEWSAWELVVDGPMQLIHEGTFCLHSLVSCNNKNSDLHTFILFSVLFYGISVLVINIFIFSIINKILIITFYHKRCMRPA